MTALRERTELLVPEQAAALASLLGVQLPDLASGEPLPLFWHWVYLLDRPAQKDLGHDGHPRNGIPVPPGPNRRRMFAGGYIRQLGHLRCGEMAMRRTGLVSTQEKRGRGGLLTFVTIGHHIFQAEQPVIEERQDIVYVDMPEIPPGSAAESSQTPMLARELRASDWSIDVTPTLLFRFSALTYNAHRIHYDRDYARSVESYPGLVTHGPLQVLAMAEAARAAGVLGSGLLECDYRLTAPLFEDQGLVVGTSNGSRRVHATVSDFSGRQTARATIAARDDQ